MEKDSFFEKLSRSLKLEDEQYEESSSGVYPKTNSAEDGENINPEVEAQEELKEEAEALAMYEQNSFNKTPKANLAMAKSQSADHINRQTDEEVTQNKNMSKSTKEEAVETEEKVKTNVTQEYEEEGRLTIDVYETENEIVIKSTIAGVEPEDLDINITSDSVTVRGKRQKEEEVSTEDYFYQECYWGAFSRSVILPTEIDSDKSDATIKNGVLTIRLPKLSKTQQKKLKVKTIS